MNEWVTPELQDLHAYVDGQLAPEARQRVEARLAADPQAQRQAEDYAAIRDGLRALYGPVLNEPVPVRLARPPHPRRWLMPLAAMAASLALLVVGGLVGVQVERSYLSPLAGSESLAREAAMAYAVYTPEVRHPVEVPGDQEQHLVSWLTKRLGTPVRAPRLDALGFELLGGRLLASNDGPGALLMYEDTHGRRVILYACLNEDKEQNTALRFSREEGVSVFYWLEGPLSYAVAGDLDRPGLLTLAEAVYQQTAI
jgi:anti-sigma factor RsiW